MSDNPSLTRYQAFRLTLGAIIVCAEHTLNSLAVDTGGAVFFNVNNLDAPLLEIRSDTSKYHVLGFEPSPIVYDGKFHPIEVRVKAPDVNVRARKGFLAIDPRQMIRDP